MTLPIFIVLAVFVSLALASKDAEHLHYTQKHPGLNSQ